MQPKDRILDLYGAFGRDVGGWIAIADTIELLGQLGVDEQAVRSAASRMKRNDLLVPVRRAGAAGYALSERALSILEEGDARIFERPRGSGNGDWVIAVFSVPERERSSRYLIRSRLADLGFGQASSAVWVAPAGVRPEAERLLRHHEVTQYVSLWSGQYVGFDDLAGVIARAWDLPAIRRRYESYLAAGRQIASRAAGRERSDRRAFVDYLDNLARWRPLPYLDPGLPVGFLPAGWPGDDARALFQRLDRELRPGAQRYFRAALTVP